MNVIVSIITVLSLLMSGGVEQMTRLPQAVNALLHKNEITSAHYTGTPSAERFNPAQAYSLESTSVIIKEKGRDFVVLNITDTHFSDYDVRAFMAFSVENTIRRLVNETKPDLITITGDIVCGDSTHYSVERFIRLMDSFGVPWAPVFGNHDAEGNCDADYLAEAMQKSSTCLLKKGDPEMGVGNYVVNIAQREANGRLNVVESFIMMDSHKTHVNKKQIDWFTWAADGVNALNGSTVETTPFFHIPLAEYQYAFDAAWDCDNACWLEGFDAAGKLNEKICCPRDENGTPVNNGFFEAAEQTGTTKYIFCGHEHMNNFSIVYRKIRLTYALKVGMGSGFQPGYNGGTVITVGENGINSIKHIFVNGLFVKTLDIL